MNAPRSIDWLQVLSLFFLCIYTCTDLYCVCWNGKYPEVPTRLIKREKGGKTERAIDSSCDIRCAMITAATRGRERESGKRRDKTTKK